MAKLRVHNFAVSLDGYAAGPAQTLENPLGTDGGKLHEWVFETPTGRRMLGESGGDASADERFMARGDEGIGATIMGRNMFGPVRGEWPDYEWTGWWGDNPPYHHPVFVLTHHPRPSVTMAGATTFHFVDDGIEGALKRAFDAADGADVRLGGGVSTIQQYLRAGLVDEMHLVVAPVLLGGGERLLDGLGGLGDTAGYESVEFIPSASVAHVRLARTPS
jgi:dihydrofolate reductase